MRENPRATELLNKVKLGEQITVGSKKFGPYSENSREILSILRLLPDEIFNPPFGQDKLAVLIEKMKPSAEKNEIKGSNKSEQLANANTSKYRVGKVRASNFRGLQLFGGPIFEFDFKGETILVSGVNGTGKSSIINAVVWVITGMLLWDRTMPSHAPKIELGKPQDIKGVQLINKAWPSEVALPSVETFNSKKIDYDCWVELELVNVDSKESTLIRREIKSTGVSSVTNLPALDTLAIELSVLMPARVNHIQFSSESQIGQVLLNVSGLEPLNYIGTYSKEIQSIVTRYSNTKTTSITGLKQKAEQLASNIIGWIPKDLEEEYKTVGLEGEPDKKIEVKQKWLSKKTYERLSHLASVLNLPECPNEMEATELASKIVAAYEPIIQNPPAMWSSLETLATAIEIWSEQEISEWENILTSSTKDLMVALEWYRKKQEMKNLELILVASKLIPNDSELSNCPLCSAPLDDSNQVRKELIMFQNLDENATKSLNEMISLCCDRIKALPKCISSIPNDFISSIGKDFETNIGRFLKGQLDGLKENAKSSIDSMVKEICFDIPTYEEITKLIEFDTEKVLDAYYQLVENCLLKLGLAKWGQKNYSSFLEKLNKTLGYVPESSVGTLIETINQCKNIAMSAKPLQDVNLAMGEYKSLFFEIKKINSEIKQANHLKESLNQLVDLKDLADSMMKNELSTVDDRMKEIYKALYGSSEFPLHSIQAKRTRRQIDFQFCLEHRGVIIEASPLINSSRVRALLWAYIFSMAELRKISTCSGWLDFILLDDPLTSFDEGHRTRFANFVFSSLRDGQWIISSHDTDWPRHIKQWGLNPKVNRVRALSCARDVVTITEWKSEVEEKLAEWIKDRKDDRLSREFVESVRIWLEEELKDLLVHCPTSSRKDDDLDSLMKKLLKGIEASDLYSAAMFFQLYNIISKLPKDIHNSHHGGPPRSRIFSDEAEAIQKHYKELSALIERCWDDIRTKIMARVI